MDGRKILGRELIFLFGLLGVAGTGVAGDVRIDGKLISTTAAGPPLQVTSSQMVANLNADLLDGSEGTDFASAATTYTKTEVDALLAAAIVSAEPRTAVNDLPGSSSAVHVISSPGSYYLRANVTGVSPKNGIEIWASNVTLDLNGFALLGVSGASSGITIGNTNYEGIEVKNGVVTGWGSGVVLQSGGCFPDACTVKYTRLERLRVTNNGAAGIVGGDGSTVSDCVVANNGNVGVFMGAGSIVTNTVASGNMQGFVTGDGSLVSDCSAVSSTELGIFAPRSVVQGCAVQGSGTDGIFVTQSLVKGNSSNQNTGSEIAATSSTVVNNHTEP